MTAKDVILEFDWTDGADLAVRAEHWADEHRPWIEEVKWGQWEGLRRQGEGVRAWKDFERNLLRWISDDSKPLVDGQPPPRRAWDKAGLRDALRTEIESASRPSKSSKQLEDYMAKLKLDKQERTEIDQYLRVQRARRFLDLLLMKVRWEQDRRRTS